MDGVKVFCGGSHPGLTSLEAEPGTEGLTQGIIVGVGGRGKLLSSNDTSTLPPLKGKGWTFVFLFQSLGRPWCWGLYHLPGSSPFSGPSSPEMEQLLPALTAAVGTVRRPGKGTWAGPDCIHCGPPIALETHAQ